MSSHKEKFKQDFERIWTSSYINNDWQAVTQAWSEELAHKHAQQELDLILWPNEEKDLQLHKDTQGKKYWKGPATIPKDFYLAHKPINEYLSDLKSYKVLDYGCGGMIRYTKILSKTFKEVIAVDACQKAIIMAKTRYLQDEKNITFIKNNGFDVEAVEDNSIGLVFSNLVFQHVGSKEILINLIKDLNRVLIPGGLLRASFWTEERPDEDYCDVYHGTGFSVEKYLEIFEDSGYKVEGYSHESPILWVSAIKENK